MSDTSVPKSHSENNNSDDTGLAVKPGLKMQIVAGVVFVKAYPELGRAAVAAGLSTPFRIWTLLRAIDPDGRGVVGHNAAMQCLAFYGLNRWHVMNALKVQAKAGITFFSVSPTKFEYASLYHVSLALKVDRALTPVLIRTDDCHKLSRFNSALYAAWLRVVGAKTNGVMISRSRLSELWGKSDTQLRKWEKLQRITVTYNVAEVKFSIDDDSSAQVKRALHALPRDERLAADRLGRAYTWTRGDSTFYQTVNKYRPCGGYTCRAGMTRKVTKRVRHELRTTEAVEEVATARGKFERVFYSKQYLEGKAWQNSVSNSSLRETGATMNGRRQHRQGRGGVKLTTNVRYQVWEFSHMRPAPKASVV